MYYKVVSINSIGDRVSALARRHASVTYHKDTITKAPYWLKKLGYGIFVFTTKQAALDFMKIAVEQNVEVELWTAEIGISMESQRLLSLHGIANREVKDMWAFPDSTIMVESIILKDLVEHRWGMK